VEKPLVPVAGDRLDRKLPIHQPPRVRVIRSSDGPPALLGE
jgi:hypothetical protein